MDISRTTSNLGIKPSLLGGNSFISNNEHLYPDFQTFLEQSPYIQNKRHHSRNNTGNTTNVKDDHLDDKVFNKGLDDYLDYFEIKKEKPSPLPSNFHSELDELAIDMSPIKVNDVEFNHQDFIIECQDTKKEGDFQKNNYNPGMHMFTSQTTEGGSPRRRMDGGPIDKNMKKMMENMQSRIMKLETENRKLKKEINDLTNQNKKYQTQVSSFISEQENFAKVKDTYEKRVKRLQDYCKNSDETMSALKKILSLQEEELVERVVKKEMNNKLSPSPTYQKQNSKMSNKLSPQRGSVNASFNLEDSRMNKSGEPKTSHRSNYGSPMSPNKNINILVTENTPKITRTQTGKGMTPIISYYDFKGEAFTKS